MHPGDDGDDVPPVDEVEAMVWTGNATTVITVL